MNLIKKVVAVTALVIGATLMLVMPASAFFSDGQSAGNGAGNANGEVVGNGNAEGEANFSMSFSGRGKAKGDVAGNGNTSGNVTAQGDGRDVYRPPYYGNPNYNFPAQEK